MMQLDHVAIAATDLAEGTAAVEAALGLSMGPGGAHPLMATHNRLLGLGDSYLEVIAPDPAAPRPPFPRWFDLDRFEGRPRPSNWILRCADLDAALRFCPRRAARWSCAAGTCAGGWPCPRTGGCRSTISSRR